MTKFPEILCGMCNKVTEGPQAGECQHFSVKHHKIVFVSPGQRFLTAICCMCALKEKLLCFPCVNCLQKGPDVNEIEI